jgi:hypothetical protein
MMNPFSSRCCQHNHAQGWPYYSEHLWMATPDNGIAALLYNSSEVKAYVGNRKGNMVMLKQTTHYPFDEHIKIEVQTAVAVNFPLYLRVPNWCSAASVKINGKLVTVKAVPGSYLRLQNDWKTGDIVELELPMTLSTKTWQQNKNSVSVNYGPVTFSLKIDESYKLMDSKQSAIGDSKWQPNADQTNWPSYEIYPASLWNYGILLNEKLLTDQMEIIKKPWPQDNYPFTADAVPLSLKVKGKLIPEWTLDKYGMCDVVPQSPVSVNTKEQMLELIPMGAARLRIASIPVVK